MKTIILPFLLLSVFLINAQHTVTGTIKNDLGPIAWANIIITTIEGDIVAGSTSNDKGDFKLAATTGNYTLTISYLGYTDYQKEIVLKENTVLGTIVLRESANNLDEVVVSYRKKLIEQKTDRVVFNVANSIAASGGNALDALKLAPGLSVQNGDISIFGRGATQVMVNDRLLPITGEELANYLNGLAADDIQKIEIITNPPAKYDATGNGGLLNIILKKGAKNSWKNTSTAVYNVDGLDYTTLRNNLLYNKGRTNLSFAVNATRGNIKNIEDFQVFYPNNTWDIAIDTKEKRNALSGRLALDYDLSDKTTVGVQYSGTKRNPNATDRTVSSIFNANDTIDSLLINNGIDREEIINHTLNAHMMTKLDTLGKKVSFDIDYFSYDSNRSRDFITETLSANNTFMNIDLTALTTSKQTIDNYSIKADMEHPLKKINLAYGIKATSIKSRSEIAFFNRASGTPVLDTNISNSFEYTEHIQAAYINGNAQLNKRLQLQLGLRLETTQTEGFSLNLNQTNRNNYSKIFPTAYISYNKDDNNSFSLSYGKRIQRPRFGNLNPFRVFVNSSTFSQGNPFLQPSFNDNIELKHSYKNSLNTSVFYSIRSNASGVIFTSDVETNTQIVTRENFFEQHTVGINENYVYDKISWLKSYAYLGLMYTKSSFTKPFDATPQNGFSYTISSSNSVSLNESTKLQIDASYNAPAQSNLFTVGETFSLDLGFRKSFLDKDLQLSIVLKDVFNTSSLNNLTSTVNGIRQVYGQSRNNRYARFSLSYNFGNKKVNVKDRAYGNEEEIKRAD